MTFENIVAKGEIAHDELTIKPSFMEIIQVFVTLVSKAYAADLM